MIYTTGTAMNSTNITTTILSTVRFIDRSYLQLLNRNINNDNNYIEA